MAALGDTQLRATPPSRSRATAGPPSSSSSSSFVIVAAGGTRRGGQHVFSRPAEIKAAPQCSRLIGRRTSWQLLLRMKMKGRKKTMPPPPPLLLLSVRSGPVSVSVPPPPPSSPPPPSRAGIGVTVTPLLCAPGQWRRSVRNPRTGDTQRASVPRWESALTLPFNACGSTGVGFS